MARHHPDDGLLMDVADGAAPEAVALAVVCHLSTCGRCRELAAAFEAAGGALLERLDGVALEPDALWHAFARSEAADVASRDPTRDDPVGLPAPLRPYLPAPGAQLPWKRLGTIETVSLGVFSSASRARLVRMAAGRAIPRHMHAGSEYVAVFAGGFTDRGQRYGPGDFCVAGIADDHAPVADPGEPCVALVVHDAPVRFTGPLLRFLNPVLR